MKLAFLLLLNLFSLLFYTFAPGYYSLNFCIVLFVFFLGSGLFLIKETIKTNNNNFFNFHVLFFISFLYVNFVYPVFIYSIDPHYFPVYKSFSFDESLISKT